MYRTHFDEQLDILSDETVKLGLLVHQNLGRSIAALLDRDMAYAHYLIQADKEINATHKRIVLDSLSMIATQQPTAGDLRRIAALMEISRELERMHDYVKGIGKISVAIGEQPLVPSMVGLLSELAKISTGMLHQAVDAFAKRNVPLAQAISQTDDQADALYDQIYEAMIVYLLENPQEVACASKLEWAAHNYERVADRSLNIAEWVVYMVEGTYGKLG